MAGPVRTDRAGGRLAVAWRTLYPYLVGVGAVLACALMRALLSGLLQTEAVYLLFLVPVVATANIGGPAPASFVAVLGAVAAPVAAGVADTGTLAGAVRLVLFSASAVAMILLSRQLRGARDAARRALDAERAATRAAEQEALAREQFVARVSHEWRGPLNTLSGWLFQLERRTTDVEFVRRAVRGMRRALDTQARLASDLLDYSRGVRGKLVIDRAPLDVREPLSAALESVQAASEAKGLLLTIDAPVEAVVSGDAVRLQQVFTNLLQNAVKFCGPGGRIAVRVVPEAAWVEVSVRDTGAGISHEALPRIFEPFGQGNVPRDAAMGGLGLGLPIALELVHLHGGSLTAASEGIGRGSVFTVRIPRGDRRPGDAPLGEVIPAQSTEQALR